MDLQERLTFFQKLISCTQELYYWCYDADGSVLTSTCPDEKVFQPIFRASGCLDYALVTPVEEPMILSNSANLTWAAVWERRDNTPLHLHVIGPCLSSGLSVHVMERARQAVLSAGNDGPDEYKDRLLAGLEQIPVISSQVFLHYAAMLGFCVTQKRFTPSDLHQQHTEPDAPPHTPVRQDRMNVYQAERLLLSTVRNGDTNTQFAHDNAAHASTLQPSVPDPLGQAQIAYTILTSLCVRAAIEGGLSPELAYSTGDRYIQKFFLTHTMTEATALKTQMYQELVDMVHRCRSDPKASKPIQDCRDFIEFHLEEPLTIELLASRLGYTKYYLSRRFKEETGCAVNTYIQIARMERAKALLVCTSLSVAQIAEKLQFASSSHFSTVFRRLAGESPAKYRTRAQSKDG